MITRTLGSESELAEYGGEWDDLVRAMPRPSPFLLQGWLLEWWRHFRGERTLAVHVALRDGALVGALPLVVKRRFGLRVAEFPGDEQFPLCDVLLAPGEERSTVIELARQARSAHDLAELYGLPAASMLRASGLVESIERLEAPVLDLAPGWEAIYQSKVSGKHRSVDRRKRKRLEEHGDVEVRVARTAADLDAALEESFRIHELRWKGRPDGSLYGTERGRRFHVAAVRNLAALDVPRIVTLVVGGRTIAFNFGLVVEGRFCSYRIGFDPDWAAFSPGYLNNLDMVEAAANEGARVVEFLGGAEEHKQQLADRFEPLHQAVGLSSSARGRAAVVGRLGALRARGALKRSERARRAVRRGRAEAARIRAWASDR